MKSQPNVGTPTNDRVYTPDDLARRCFDHFKPQGIGLDPSRGRGAFFNLMPTGSEWCEIDDGRDFFLWTKRADYLMTNPPWSLFRRFVQHGMELADNLYYLITVNHVFTKARLKDVYGNGWGVKEIFMFDTPKNFPQSGFQVGMIHFQKGWRMCDGIVLSSEGQSFATSVEPLSPRKTIVLSDADKRRQESVGAEDSGCNVSEEKLLCQ